MTPIAGIFTGRTVFFHQQRPHRLDRLSEQNTDDFGDDSSMQLLNTLTAALGRSGTASAKRGR